jgi:hypothetical protein
VRYYQIKNDVKSRYEIEVWGWDSELDEIECIWA